MEWVTEQQDKTQKRSSNKKTFINEEIFGKNKPLDDVPVEEGLSHLSIKPHEIGNIPGLIQHWEMDVKKRKQAILEWKHQSVLKRTLQILKRKNVSPIVSGMEIAKLHPTKTANDLVKKLKQDPTDMVSRLELVSIIAKSGREFPIEVYRGLLLNATVACCFGELSNAGLKNVIWIQDIYFTKLYLLCKREVQNFESKSKTKAGENNNAYSQQVTKIRKRMGTLKNNMEIIQSYQKQGSKVLKDIKSTHHNTLHINDFTNYVLSSKKSADKSQDEKKISLFKKSAELILLARALPLLKEQAKEFSNYLKKIDSNDPLTHFLHGKINMSDLIFKVNQYQGGSRAENLQQDILNAFQETYRHYGFAVKKVGKMPKTKIERATMIEYASLVHYFYNVARTTLGLRLPKAWLHTALSKAYNMLRLIQDKAQVETLMNDLQKDMAIEGFIN